MDSIDANSEETKTDREEKIAKELELLKIELAPMEKASLIV